MIDRQSAQHANYRPTIYTPTVDRSAAASAKTRITRADSSIHIECLLAGGVDGLVKCEAG